MTVVSDIYHIVCAESVSFRNCIEFLVIGIGNHKTSTASDNGIQSITNRLFLSNIRQDFRFVVLEQLVDVNNVR